MPFTSQPVMPGLISNGYYNRLDFVFIAFTAVSSRAKNQCLFSLLCIYCLLTIEVTCLFAVAFRRNPFVTLFETQCWSRDIVPGPFSRDTGHWCRTGQLTYKRCQFLLKTHMHACTLERTYQWNQHVGTP